MRVCVVCVCTCECGVCVCACMRACVCVCVCVEWNQPNVLPLGQNGSHESSAVTTHNTALKHPPGRQHSTPHSKPWTYIFTGPCPKHRPTTGLLTLATSGYIIVTSLSPSQVSWADGSTLLLFCCCCCCCSYDSFIVSLVSLFVRNTFMFFSSRM